MSTRILQISASQTLIVIRSDTDVFEVQAVYAPHGTRPPAHLHPRHDEHLRVLSGTLRADVDGTVVDLVVDDTLDIRRGQAHSIWNISDEQARTHWTSAPAMQCDTWFSGLAELTARTRLRDRATNSADLAALQAAHSDTFRLVE